MYFQRDTTVKSSQDSTCNAGLLAPNYEYPPKNDLDLKQRNPNSMSITMMMKWRRKSDDQNLFITTLLFLFRPKE
jgi:hypothetical protein